LETLKTKDLFTGGQVYTLKRTLYIRIVETNYLIRNPADFSPDRFKRIKRNAPSYK